MSSNLLMMLVFLVLGLFLIIQGLPGLLSSEMTIRGKYRRQTHYTGNKAVAIGFGTVGMGLMIILNGIFLVGTNPIPKSPFAMIGMFIGLGVYLISWVVSWFVDGTAERERRESWWF